ncbi:FtsX-like permease family protein [Arhodomonas sp. AD133]|uniref:ABC transporter permease n=1 Tax=Arhodomonas sp. AD133 TaxID=3415009 RepID=UPI003EBE397D
MRATMTLVWAHRQAWGMRYRLLGIAAILGIAAGLFIGIYSSIDSLYSTRDTYYRQLSAADLEVTFVPSDRANVPDLDDVEGVATWTTRLMSPGQLVLADGSRHASTVITRDLADPAPIDELQVLQGTGLERETPNAVLIERTFADHFGVEPGDALTLKVGNARYDLDVAGIALSPDYLLAPSSPNYFVPLKGAVGVVFAPHRLIADRLNFSLVNSVRVTYAQGADPADVRQRVRERLSERLQIDAVTPRSQQFGSLFLKVDLDAFAIFVPAIILVFLVATVIVGLFLIVRWIAAQKETLGVYMALGYPNRRLVLAQCYPMLLVAVCAAVIAIPVAYATLYDFGLIYADALGMPDPLLAVRPAYLGQGLAGVLLCTFLMAAWPLARVLRLTPQEAVRGVEASRSRGGGGRVMRLVSGLRNHITVFYPLRSLMRGRVVTGLTVISVGLALGVSLSYLIAGDSYLYTIDRGFDRDRWDVSVGFMVPMWSDELGPYRSVDGVSDVEGYLRGNVRLSDDGSREPALLTGVPAGTSMRRTNITSGRGLQPGDEEAIVLEYNLAQRLGVEPGDRLTVERDDDTFSAQVAGVFSGTTPGAVYAPLETVQRWLDMEDQVTGILLRTSGAPGPVATELRRMDRVASVTPKDELTRKVLDLTSQILSIIYVTTAFSVVVAVIILIASTSFTVMERRQEYGVLRVLGFADGTVRRMLVGEVALLGFMGIVLSMPIGYTIARFLNARLSDAWFLVLTDVSWQSLAVAWLPALVALPLAAAPSVRTILTTPLVQLLRQRRLG